MLFYAILFVSGGAVLALELLASRIMTPYFGVSLYIWTGILSITLVALALGYWAGGKLAAQRLVGTTRAERLAQYFTVMPAVAGFAVIAACLVYPYLFAALAAFDLVAGAFIACLVLLFLPLASASAMNPLLVAYMLARGGRLTGDAGAGKVFFASTLGSVAGVVITAFALIPYVSNFSAALIVALFLALLSLAAATWSPVPLAARKKLSIAAGAAALLATVLLWQAEAYTGRMWPAAYNGASWRIEASFRSLFGTVKVLRTEADPQTKQFTRIYFQDGLIQNTVASDGRSLSFYTYALEALALSYRPQFTSALVLGLGAGIVPMRLAKRGAAVEVVEIDPASLAAARRIFGYELFRAAVHLEDARTFLRGCIRSYDVIVVDLFHGDGTPDYLVTRNFFRDLKGCLAPNGVAVFNTFADLERPAAYAHLLTTLRAELPHIVVYRPDWPGAVQVNSFIVASANPLRSPERPRLTDIPLRHDSVLAEMLERPQALTRELLGRGQVVTDARSAAAYDIAQSQIRYRKSIVESVPPAFLVN
ncbi:MAG TPA: fused MFS/spermidine synthase [Burkholderiales bacterium]|nr:fused MFS/spermidine synthase [Burkholderiales bacterium]